MEDLDRWNNIVNNVWDYTVFNYLKVIGGTGFERIWRKYFCGNLLHIF